MSKLLTEIKQAVSKWAGRLRGVISSRNGRNHNAQISIVPTNKVATAQSRERVISLTYRKNKSQQQNWRKWKKGGW